MTAFAYTTGNPNNLVANQNASMADIQGPLTDLRTFINGGTMDETNVPNLAAAFTTYKRLAYTHGDVGFSGVATLLLQTGFQAATAVPPANVSAFVANHVILLDPTLYAANSRTTKLQVRVGAVPNVVPPAITMTVGLYPVANYAGSSGASPLVNALGTVVSGSTVAIASPSALALTTGASSDFNFPAAGAYVLAVLSSGASAVGSFTDLIASLEMRQV